MNAPDKKERPQEHYDRLNAVKYTLKIIKRTEADVLQKLDSVPNKAGYIKRLIREDIAKNGI